MPELAKSIPDKVYTDTGKNPVYSPVTGSAVSCGVHQLFGFYHDKPEDELLDTMRWKEENFKQWYCAFYVFSDYNFWQNRRSKGPQLGKNLADYIQKNKLGKITESDEAKNPNSGNIIQVWIWEVDWKALKAWCKERKLSLTIP